MPRSKIDPAKKIITLFVTLPLGEASLLLKYLATSVEAQMRNAANGDHPKRKRAAKVALKVKPVAVPPATFAPENEAAARGPRRRGLPAAVPATDPANE